MKAHITLIVVLILAFCFGSTALAAELPDLSKRLLAAMENTNATTQLEDSGVEFSYIMGPVKSSFRHTGEAGAGVCLLVLLQDNNPRQITFYDTGCDEKVDRVILLNTKTGEQKEREVGSRINRMYGSVVVSHIGMARTSAMAFPKDSDDLDVPQDITMRDVLRLLRQVPGDLVDQQGILTFAYAVGPYSQVFTQNTGLDQCTLDFTNANQHMLRYRDEGCDGSVEKWSDSTEHKHLQEAGGTEQEAYTLGLARLAIFAKAAEDLF